MNFKELYRRKVVSVEEALQEIKSGQELVCGLVACEPVTLLRHLHTIRDRVEDVSVVTALLMNEYDFFINTEMQGHFLMNSWFYTGGARKAHPQGTVSYIRWNFIVVLPVGQLIASPMFSWAVPRPWINMVSCPYP